MRWRSWLLKHKSGRKKFEVEVEVQRGNLLSIFDRGFNLDVMTKEPEIEDWRSPITQYLKNPSFPTSKKNRQQATKYVVGGESVKKNSKWTFVKMLRPRRINESNG